jgi:hypothetical protein
MGESFAHEVEGQIMRIQGRSGTLTTADDEQQSVIRWMLDIEDQLGLKSWGGTAEWTSHDAFDHGPASIAFIGNADDRWTGNVVIRSTDVQDTRVVVRFEGISALYRNGQTY